MPGGHQGGDGDSAHLREDAGGQGKEKLKAWLGTWFQVTLGFFETGVEKGGREESRAPLSAPPQATWGTQMPSARGPTEKSKQALT